MEGNERFSIDNDIAYVGGHDNRRGEGIATNDGSVVPIATPASLHENNNIRNLMTAAAALPPLPMVTTNDNALNNISPATPMLPPVDIASGMRTEKIPASTQSQNTLTVAALYQCSRRSRTRTNSPWNPGTSMAHPVMPPPPLFTPHSMESSQQVDAIEGNNAAAAGSNIHKISLQSSNTSSILHESWNTSMHSLMNSSYMNTSLNNVYDFRESHVSQGPAVAEAATTAPPSPNTGGRPNRQLQLQRPNLMGYKMEDRNYCRRLSQESQGHSSTARSHPLQAFSDDKSRQLPMGYKMEGGDGNGISPGMVLTVPTLSGDSTYSPESAPPVGCMDEFSSLQVRGKCARRATHEENADSNSVDGKGNYHGNGKDGHLSSQDDEGGGGSHEPPKKKNKMKNCHSFKTDNHHLSPRTTQSCGSTASFDIIAQPSSRVSSIHDDSSVPFNEASVAGFLTKYVKDYEMGILMKGDDDQQGNGICSKVSPAKAPQEIRQNDIHEPNESQGYKEPPSKKDQRILRRKIQRLLLIRHCSICRISPLALAAPSSPDQCATCEDDGETSPFAQLTTTAHGAVCPVTSHCAEGKALCAHIRTCKLENCNYKKCLTSREVVGHFKNCRDMACEICSPVRALDRRHKGHIADSKQRRGSDCNSSINTIDDEGWLDTNMVEGDNHNVSDVPA